MELKKRKSKVSYTVMIISDSAKKHIKKFHLKSSLAGVMTAMVFMLLVVLICYLVYSSITLSDSLERSKKQMDQITQLKEEKTQLEYANEELAGKILILSETINQKVEAEEVMAAAQEEMHFPKGFPLSGTAQIKTEETEENNTDEAQDQEAQSIVKDTDKKEIIFTAVEGINVIASGSGVVVAVEEETGYGNSITIDHENGYMTTYRNKGKPTVKVGDELTRGAILYVVGEGNTDMGYSIKKEDTYIDPMEIIEING